VVLVGTRVVRVVCISAVPKGVRGAGGDSVCPGGVSSGGTHKACESVDGCEGAKVRYRISVQDLNERGDGGGSAPG
jgi:hypothetical protein